MRCFRFFFVFVLVFNLVVLGSCVSFDTSESSSWASGKNEKLRGIIRIISVSVEKSGEWGGLEKELNDLTPLLFSEQGYVTVFPDDREVAPAGARQGFGSLPVYSAEVKIREREYPDGWQTRRSLSAELRLWAGDDYTCQPLPLSAGRVLNNGKKSFASSKTLSAMLRKAIRNALGALPPESRNAGGESR